MKKIVLALLALSWILGPSSVAYAADDHNVKGEGWSVTGTINEIPAVPVLAADDSGGFIPDPTAPRYPGKIGNGLHQSSSGIGSVPTRVGVGNQQTYKPVTSAVVTIGSPKKGAIIAGSALNVSVSVKMADPALLKKVSKVRLDWEHHSKYLQPWNQIIGGIPSQAALSAFPANPVNPGNGFYARHAKVTIPVSKYLSAGKSRVKACIQDPNLPSASICSNWTEFYIGQAQVSASAKTATKLKGAATALGKSASASGLGSKVPRSQMAQSQAQARRKADLTRLTRQMGKMQKQLQGLPVNRQTRVLKKEMQGLQRRAGGKKLTLVQVQKLQEKADRVSTQIKRAASAQQRSRQVASRAGRKKPLLALSRAGQQPLRLASRTDMKRLSDGLKELEKQVKALQGKGRGQACRQCPGLFRQADALKRRAKARHLGARDAQKLNQEVVKLTKEIREVVSKLPAVQQRLRVVPRLAPATTTTTPTTTPARRR